MLTVSFIGLGNRGGIYGKYFFTDGRARIVSACDKCKENVNRFHLEFGVDKTELFYDEETFFEKKRSDVLVIATPDREHYRHAKTALRLGYDLLMEKPVAPTAEETADIIDTAKKLGRNVVVCHNLRYTPFYQGIKRIVEDGLLGEVLSVEQSENVSYFHYLTSFVRGNWRKEDLSSAIILQKCCHDLDIIYWLIDKKCEKIASFGGLHFYCEDSAPKGSAHYCVDCDLKNCPYNAVDIYTKYHEMMNVPYGFDYSDENIKRYLSERSHHYGDCVFHSDNDVCDRQIVGMRFSGGVTASLLMQGFAATITDRTTSVYGSKGYLTGKLNDGKIKVNLFGKQPCEIDYNAEIRDGASHNGGDAKLVSDYITFRLGQGRPMGISLAEDSHYSHKLAFAAEQSRLAGGKSLTVE